MQVLNFFSTVFADQMKRGRKTATIRLGDKRLKELSPRDIEHDNPEFRRTEELVNFLQQIYDREVSFEDTVTVVRFSQIVENPPDLQDRLRGVGGAQN